MRFVDRKLPKGWTGRILLPTPPVHPLMGVPEEKMKIVKLILSALVIAAALFADPAPDIDLVDLEGKWHNMNTYVKQGKYIAYDFVTLG